MNFIKINNLKEYKNLLQSLYDNFSCEEEWESYFGFELKWDEDTGEVLETLEEYQGNIEVAPEENEYPIVCVYAFDETFDRFGEIKTRIFDWGSMGNL